LSDALPPGLLRRSANGVLLEIRLTPKAGRDVLAGIEAIGETAVLRAKVRAAPDSGQANAALAKLIANWADLPPSAVKLVKGGKSRRKTLLIEGDADRLVSILSALLAKFC
jgi:uncharacterized protein